MRILVEPPLTMLLIIDGFITVQQEIEACILMPTDFIEEPVSKKRKTQSSMELFTGRPSEHKEPPQFLVAIAKPIPLHDTDIDSGNPLQFKGNSSKQGNPISFITTIEPTITKNVLINTIENDTSKFNPVVLKDIWQQYNHANH